ncbi:hypothetical protein JL49_09020 [Pseudoalteromonas luteoviolacea]|nr:hypothetical protein JL49_09020 [Pseudoalteromonas luteoviolacea]
MPHLTVPAGAPRPLKTSKRWLSILNATDQFAIDIPGHGEVAGMAGRQYGLEDISTVHIVNTGDDELHIEYDQADIAITSVADGNVSVVNSVNIERIEREVSVLSRSHVGQSINTLDDVVLESGHRVQLVAASQHRAELIIRNISVNPADVRIGGEQVSDNNGQLAEQSGGLVISNGAAVWAYNPSERPVKLACMEVMQ